MTVLLCDKCDKELLQGEPYWEMKPKIRGVDKSKVKPITVCIGCIIIK